MDMLFQILDIVRVQILEKIPIPLMPAPISYWKFILIVTIVTIIVVAFVNSVKVTGGD